MSSHQEEGFPEKLKRDLWNEQRGLCNYCDSALILNGGCRMDHLVPKSFGGSTVKENAQLLCCTCYGIKSFHVHQIALSAAKQNIESIKFEQPAVVIYSDEESGEEPYSDEE